MSLDDRVNRIEAKVRDLEVMIKQIHEMIEDQKLDRYGSRLELIEAAMDKAMQMIGDAAHGWGQSK